MAALVFVGARPPAGGRRRGRRALGPPVPGGRAAAGLPRPARHRRRGAGCCGSATRGRCPRAAGRCNPAWPSRSPPRTCPTRPRCSPRPGPGPATRWPSAVRLALPVGRCTWAGSSPPQACATSSSSTALAPSMVGTSPPSVSAPPPAGPRKQTCSSRTTSRSCPGCMGVQVYENGTDDAGDRGSVPPLLPVTRTWSYPAAADVVGWQPVLSALSDGAPAAAPVPGRHPLRRVRAGRELRLAAKGRAVAQPAGLRLGGPVRRAAKGQATLSFSQFPYVPLAVLLELAAWVLLDGRHRSAAAGGAASPAPAAPVAAERARRDGGLVTPGPREPRAALARGCCWWSLVVAGVGIAVGIRGTPAPVGAAPRPERARRCARRRVVAPGTAPGRRPPGRVAGLPRADQHDGAAGHRDITAVTDTGATVHTAVAVPAHGVVAPPIPALLVGLLGVRDGDDRRAAGWRSPRPCTARRAGPRRRARAPRSASWYFAGGSTADADPLYRLAAQSRPRRRSWSTSAS